MLFYIKDNSDVLLENAIIYTADNEQEILDVLKAEALKPVSFGDYWIKIESYEGMSLSDQYEQSNGVVIDVIIKHSGQHKHGNNYLLLPVSNVFTAA